MINLFRKSIRGAAMLVITVVLLVTSTIIIIFAASQGRILQKIVSNQYRNSMAFQAAEAGLEFGIAYLEQNHLTILANPINGIIPIFSNSETTNVTLANNSQFSIVYTNPIPFNYTFIKVTSTGRSDDTSATRVVSQLVQFGSLLSTPPSIPVESKGSISMGGNASVTNLEGNTAIGSASTISLSGSSTTLTQSGLGNPASIQQNNSTLQNLSLDDFFVRYFGSSKDDIKSKVAHYYSNTNNTNYSGTINGMTGTSIWIDQLSNSTASLSGGTVIGSATHPVLLIINGNFAVSGNVLIYGFVFIMGTTGITNLTGNTQIIGALVTTDTLNMTGSISIAYDSTVLQNLRNEDSLSFYAKVPGSWKDF